MKDFLSHLFLPRHTNNHRPKILHHQSLILVITFLFVSQFIFFGVKQQHGHVLGITTDITTQRLLSYTNEIRTQKGLQPLTINNALSLAAREKSSYMFEKNFWSHDGPDGTTPWYFIKQANYNYTYAGENLARGFATSEEVVDAWMASQTHRENMLSPQYNDIGFAVSHGTLLGEDTTLVVELFGSTNAVDVAKPLPKTIEPVVNKADGLTKEVFASDTFIGNAYQKTPLVNRKLTAQTISLLIVGIFILVLAVDMHLTKKRKVIRHIGHNLDHIFFLTLMILAIVLIGGGIIL